MLALGAGRSLGAGRDRRSRRGGTRRRPPPAPSGRARTFLTRRRAAPIVEVAGRLVGPRTRPPTLNAAWGGRARASENASGGGRVASKRHTPYGYALVQVVSAILLRSARAPVAVNIDCRARVRIVEQGCVICRTMVLLNPCSSSLGRGWGSRVAAREWTSHRMLLRRCAPIGRRRAAAKCLLAKLLK